MPVFDERLDVYADPGSGRISKDGQILEGRLDIWKRTHMHVIASSASEKLHEYLIWNQGWYIDTNLQKKK